MTLYEITPRAPEPLVDEPVAAPFAGFTALGLKRARLLGADAPPHIRVGPRRIKYSLAQVLAWRDSRTVHALQPAQPATSMNNFHQSPTDSAINPSSTAAAQDSTIVALDRSRDVQRAARAVLLDLRREQAVQSQRALLIEAIRATEAAGIKPTDEAIIATLTSLSAAAKARTAEALTDAELVREANRRHAERVRPVIEAIQGQVSMLEQAAASARRSADALLLPAAIDEVRRDLMAIGGIDVAKAQALIDRLPQQPTEPARAEEAARLAEEATQAQTRAAALRALLADAPILDLAAVARVAQGHPVVLTALDQVQSALGTIAAGAEEV